MKIMVGCVRNCEYIIEVPKDTCLLNFFGKKNKIKIDYLTKNTLLLKTIRDEEMLIHFQKGTKKVAMIMLRKKGKVYFNKKTGITSIRGGKPCPV